MAFMSFAWQFLAGLNTFRDTGQTLIDHNVEEVVNTSKSFINLLSQFGNGTKHVGSIVRGADFVDSRWQTWDLFDDFVQIVSNVLGGVATLCSPTVCQKLYKGPIFWDVVEIDSKIGVKISEINEYKQLNIRQYSKLT